MSNYGGLNKIPRLYAFGARGGEQEATLGGKVHNDGLTIGPEQITTFRMHGDTPKSPVKPNDAGEKSGKPATTFRCIIYRFNIYKLLGFVDRIYRENISLTSI